MYVDYIYLDTDERRQFAQVQHKILCVAKRSLKDFVSENAYSIFAILINCGDILKIFTTILKKFKRTRLKIVPKGKNVNNSKHLLGNGQSAGNHYHGFSNDYRLIGNLISLKYSLDPRLYLWSCKIWL